MVPFLNLLGLHDYNAFPEHLVDITDSRSFPLSLLLVHAIIRAKTIDSSSVRDGNNSNNDGKSVWISNV
jgi:hypothetical protein